MLVEHGGRSHYVPEREDVSIYGVLAALADPTRLEIVRSLDQKGEGCVSSRFPEISKQSLWHHYKVLRDAGLIESRYDGRTKYTTLRRKLIDELFPGLLDSLLRAISEK